MDDYEVRAVWFIKPSVENVVVAVRTVLLVTNKVFLAMSKSP